MTIQITFEASDVPLGTVSDEMFGGNFLIDRDRMGEGTYDEAISDLGLTNLRYPGGTVAEWFFDITDPDKTIGWDPERQEWRELLPLSDFLADASAQDVGVDIVIPTGNLLGDGDLGSREPAETAFEDVRSFVYDLLSGAYGEAEVVTLEIGNEYWLGGGMDVTEYARVASVIAEAAQAAIDQLRSEGTVPADWNEPEIAIQRGQYGKYSTENGWVQNEYLIGTITDAAADAIDAVVTHYYAAGDYDDLASTAYRFDYLDDWNEDERYGDLEYYVTEWNVAGNASDELGMRGASVMYYMFSEMVMRGVDAAYVWPVQQTTDITLTGDDGSTSLTIAGEAFRLLADSVSGMELTARHAFDSGHVYVYESDAETVVYVASRADASTQIALDLAALGLDGSVYQATRLRAEGLVADPDATPVVSVSAGYADTGQPALFDIDAYGILRVTFELAPDLRATTLGTEGNDIMDGTGAGDTLEGRGGDDRLNGSGGADVLIGGDGDDVIDGGDQADRIFAGAGNDVVYGGNGTDDVDLGGGDDVFWDNLQGGTYGVDTVRGGGGNDTINGGAGNDRFFGDADNDVIKGSGGNDTIAGGPGDDRLWGGTDNDEIQGDDGDDKLFGDSGDDGLEGGDGCDVLKGGDGDDSLSGGNDDDRLFGEAGNDRLEGGSGRDRLLGGAGHDVLLGDDGDDKIYGEAQADILQGGAGRDRLEGGDGDDILTGGSGDDRLLGQAGTDTFVFGPADGHDVILDFEDGETIRIEKTGLGFADLTIRYHNDGDVEVSFAETDVVLRDFGAMLDAGDFQFV